jgi:peptidoglycan-associated lipoprotein
LLFLLSAVAVYLELMGVDPARLSTVSYGKDNPVDPAHNEEAWAKNRRATTMKVDYE